jgi:hypothetical protein
MTQNGNQLLRVMIYNCISASVEPRETGNRLPTDLQSATTGRYRVQSTSASPEIPLDR